MRIKFLFLLLIAIIFLPILITTVYLYFKRDTKQNMKIERYIRVYDAKEDKIYELELEGYICSVVAAEMPIGFEEEALCAQAIAARSFAVSKMLTNRQSKYDVTLDYNHDQAYISKEKLKEKWKENYETNIQKLERIVETTRGKVLKYNNEIVNAYFHSTSAGMTQNSGDVWLRDYPYLMPVKSDESLSPKKSNECVYTFENIIDSINAQKEVKDKLEKNSNLEIKDIERNKSGYVKSLKINEKFFSGMEIRKMLGLNSNSFYIDIDEETQIVTFKVFGFGHGVGMSQYGANKMAMDGKSYEDILKHYYSGIRIESIEYNDKI